MAQRTPVRTELDEAWCILVRKSRVTQSHRPSTARFGGRSWAAARSIPIDSCTRFRQLSFAMNPLDRRRVALSFVAILGFAVASLNACGPRAKLTPDGETPTAGSAEPIEDEQPKDPPMTEEEERAARERADVEPLQTADAEKGQNSEPEVDAKGKKKLKAPDSEREPLMKKPANSK